MDGIICLKDIATLMLEISKYLLIDEKWLEIHTMYACYKIRNLTELPETLYTDMYQYLCSLKLKYCC